MSHDPTDIGLPSLPPEHRWFVRRDWDNDLQLRLQRKRKWWFGWTTLYRSAYMYERDWTRWSTEGYHDMVRAKAADLNRDFKNADRLVKTYGVFT